MRGSLCSHLAQEFRRRRIDTDWLVSRASHRFEHCGARGGSEKRIAGQMDERRLSDKRIGDVAGFERFVGAAVGEEAALAIRIDQRHQSPSLAARIADKMRRDADRFESRCFAVDVGGGDAGDEVDLHAERGEPCRLIGRRPAGLKRDRRAPVRAARERSLGAHDDVRHHIADDEDAETNGSTLKTGTTLIVRGSHAFPGFRLDFATKTRHELAPGCVRSAPRRRDEERGRGDEVRIFIELWFPASIPTDHKNPPRRNSAVCFNCIGFYSVNPTSGPAGE